MYLDVTCRLLQIAKYLEQEGIAKKKIQFVYTHSSIEIISCDNSSRFFCMMFQTFFIAPCLANLSDVSLKKKLQSV